MGQHFSAEDLMRMQDRRACNAIADAYGFERPYGLTFPESEPKAETPAKRYYATQPCSPDCAWALAMRRDGPRHVTIDAVIKAVCQHFHINKRELLSSRRSRYIVRPRQGGMYLCRLLTSRSLPEIGRRFGNRDHTTVLHAVAKVTELEQQDSDFRRDLDMVGVYLAGNDYWHIKANAHG